MRITSVVLIGFTVMLFTVFIISSLTTLSVKDDELEYAVSYAAEMTIESLDNGHISGDNIKANESYQKYYHYDIAVKESIQELYDANYINEEQRNHIEKLNFSHVDQIINSEYVRGIKSTLPEYFANIVLEKVFMNALLDVRDSNASYNVKFYLVDAVKGILDVEVIQTSKYSENNTAETSVRKTVIKENFLK